MRSACPRDALRCGRGGLVMLRELRFGCRLFARRPAFFLTAVATIALGIGLSATVFAVVDGVLFRPLQYREPDRLVALYGAVRAEQQAAISVSWQDLADWRPASHRLAAME